MSAIRLAGTGEFHPAGECTIPLRRGEIGCGRVGRNDPQGRGGRTLDAPAIDQNLSRSLTLPHPAPYSHKGGGYLRRKRKLSSPGAHPLKATR